ncbi:hypothetical protein [Olleya sp. R77988]
MAEFPPRWLRKLGKWFGKNISNGKIPFVIGIGIIIFIILI